MGFQQVWISLFVLDRINLLLHVDKLFIFNFEFEGVDEN